MARDFSATVGEWCRDVDGGLEAIFKESTQRVVRTMQRPRRAGGRMRIDTGFLRASLLASTTAMPSIIPGARPVKGQTYSYSGNEISAVIAGSELGQTIFIGYTAGYAAHREYGARGQAPDAFVRTAASRWQRIVDDVARKLQSRLG